MTNTTTKILLTIHSGLHALSQGQYQEVHTQCLSMIKSNIEDSVPYFLLAVIAYDHKNYKKAEELFLRAEALNPRDSHAPAYLGRLYADIQQSEEAIKAANRAAKTDIIHSYIADMLGVIYSRASDHERAIDFFKRAVKLDGKRSNFHYNLGASEQFLGDFEGAERAYLKAVELDKNHYGAWSSLTSLHKQTQGSNHLDTLKKLYERLSGNEDARHQLGHAIAKTLEDLGQHEPSLDWLHKAKEGKLKRYGYDRAEGTAVFNAARQTVRATSKGFENGPTPIFIVGLPRTGTTLVDRILSSHSNISSAGELNFFADSVKSFTKTSSNLVLDAETLSTAAKIDLSLVGQDYMQRAQERIGGAGYFVDKMPLNFFYAALMSTALPKAKIIALRRGAMDSCLSNYRQLLSTQQSFYNYTYDLEDIAHFYKEFDGLMSHWRAELPENRFMEVKYEDIVFDQENQTRKLLEFCGLPFEEACMNFHQNSAPVSTASSVQVRQPLYSGSIGRWKKYGTKLDKLRQALGDLAD